MLRLSLCLLVVAGACRVAPPEAETPVVHVRFDPEAGVLPKPTDILRDATAGRLDLPAAPEDLEDKTAAEAALVRALNERDGWPSTMTAELSTTGPLDPASITQNAVRIFEIDEAGRPRLLDLMPRGEPALAPTRVLIDPPAGGWLRGRTYFAVALGGPSGLVGQSGEQVVADAVFYFLRATQPLTGHPDALEPEQAADLEEIRLELAPYFAHLEQLGLLRSDVVALWHFTATEAVEVVMDKASGKMPLPSDFLREPTTGRVDLPALDSDTELERNAKADLSKLDGFALSADLLFELSGPFDPDSLQGNVRLFAVPEDAEPYEIDVTAEARQANTAVRVALPERPLAPATPHLLVLTKDFVDTRGRPIAPMLPDMLAMLDAPIYDGTASTVDSVDGESAARVEFVRQGNRRGLEAVVELVPEDRVGVAWPFTTLSIAEPMQAMRDATQRAMLSPDPENVERKSPVQAALDFPLSALTLLRVGDVYEGTIKTADFLDPLTRKFREDGSWEQRDLDFVMTVPAGHDPDDPLPVVIFGHGLMTERRFVLAIGDALAAEGMAAIAVDLPYHGRRTHCVSSGPQCLVNPLDQTGDMICPAACERGTTCAPDGRCVDSAGDGNSLNNWPIVSFPQASGGAFVDVDNMVGTRDHFYQAIADLGALRRSLVQGDWASSIGTEIDPEVRYIGQSLGGILGAVFVAVSPGVRRAVLNVPGADLIDLFRESTLFSSHFEAFLAREEIEQGSEAHERILNIARWITDPVDPQSFAPYLVSESFTGADISDRRILVQMATLDLIIGNPQTELLARLAGIPREDYLAEHAFLVVPVEPAYLRGTREAARLLGRGELP